ncbi:MAG: hypothetical protein MZV70_12510 [Desulfobacterales bacterium]|nr:hypothetical protein [Desulfobacterales bacterium]
MSRVCPDERSPLAAFRDKSTERPLLIAEEETARDESVDVMMRRASAGDRQGSVSTPSKGMRRGGSSCNASSGHYDAVGFPPWVAQCTAGIFPEDCRQLMLFINALGSGDVSSLSPAGLQLTPSARSLLFVMRASVWTT